MGPLVSAGLALPGVGAPMPWRTYEAEAMDTDGTVLGPGSAPYHVETESSGLRCVRLSEAGQFVQFVVAAPANSIVVRYCLPDAAGGGGLRSSLGIYVNGRKRAVLPLDSRLAWLYGRYPFPNDPAQGRPRHFYDETRLAGLSLLPGDRVRLQWEKKDVPWCILDLVDLEETAPPRARPAGSLAVTDFGARGDGATDDTTALRRAVGAAARTGGVVWVPAGDFRITGEIAVPSHVTIRGAGMWQANFVGDAKLYAHSDRRVRFTLKGDDIVLSDFSIRGQLDYRNDQEPNDGIVGAGCADCVIRRIWIEHTKVGIWVYNGARLRIEDCRIRDTLADGINLCVGTYGTVVENCTARGTGDDCFAIWPAAFDQGFGGRRAHPGGNLFRHCTGQLPYLANGGAIYGGESNRIEDCAFTDITAGCGLLVSTTFPTDDPAHGIDNNFSGTTVIQNCVLLRCGGYDHDWEWRGSLQICLDRRSIAGLRISGVRIVDSLSDGITVVAPGSRHGQGMLSDAEIASSVVAWTSPAAAHRGLWIRSDAAGALRLVDDALGPVVNDSPQFKLTTR